MNVHVVLQNALQWLHECCMGLVLGRKPEHETSHFFSGKVAAAMKGSLCGRRVRALRVDV